MSINVPYVDFGILPRCIVSVTRHLADRARVPPLPPLLDLRHRRQSQKSVCSGHGTEVEINETENEGCLVLGVRAE